MEIVRRQEPRAYEKVANQIEQQIRDRKILPGERLVSERKLAETLGVGRNAVREAMRSLASKGLLEIHAGGGAFVREPHVEDYIEVLSSAMIKEKDTLMQLLDARQLIEVGITEMAAAHGSDDEIEAIIAAGEKLSTKMLNDQAAAEDDLLFHSLIAKASHNRVLIDVMAMLTGVMRNTYSPGLTVLIGKDNNREMYCNQVRGIGQALRARDGKRAAELMKEHVAVSAKELRRLIGESFA